MSINRRPSINRRVHRYDLVVSPLAALILTIAALVIVVIAVVAS